MTTSSKTLRVQCHRFAVVAAALFLTASAGAAAWDASAFRGPAGNFPPLPMPYRAQYRIGWGGLTAARANLQIGRRGDEIAMNASAATTGAARALWSLDATLRAAANGATLRPLRVDQVEDRGKKTLRQRATFIAGAVERTYGEYGPNGAELKPVEQKRYEGEALNDFLSAFLLMRSQPLENGQSRTLAVMSPAVPYLVTLTVRGREEVQLRTGPERAVRVSVDSVSKVQPDGTLKPNRRFRRATVWVSDDAKREILRIESDVFIGAIFLEIDRG